jgi:hypothetical protein
MVSDSQAALPRPMQIGIPAIHFRPFTVTRRCGVVTRVSNMSTNRRDNMSAKVRFGIAIFDVLASFVCILAGDYVAAAVCVFNAMMI